MANKQYQVTTNPLETGPLKASLYLTTKFKGELGGEFIADFESEAKANEVCEILNQSLKAASQPPAVKNEGEQVYTNHSSSDWIPSLQEPTQPPAVKGLQWVKGEYERLYDLLKAGVERPIACFVDYIWDRKQAVKRDICMVKTGRLDFNSRGIGYGGASHVETEYERETFLEDCVRLNVEWLDESGESPTAAGETEQLCAKLKEHIIADLTRNQSEADKPYLISGRISYTKQQLAQELQNNTPAGIDLLSKVVLLSLDLMARGKAAAAGDGKEDACDFAEWCQMGYVISRTGLPGCHWTSSYNEQFPDPEYTTAQLYDIFKQQNK